MEHFIKIAIWIVTLSGCLQAHPIPIEDLNIPDMRRNVNCTIPNSTFYAPTNVTKCCITKALKCIMEELHGTVKQECEDPEGYIDQAVDFFNATIDARKDKDHEPKNCKQCDCERWSQTSFDEFLSKTESLLQFKNSIEK